MLNQNNIKNYIKLRGIILVLTGFYTEYCVGKYASFVIKDGNTIIIEIDSIENLKQFVSFCILENKREIINNINYRKSNIG
ncbi:MAG: hypothetical protein RBT59_13565 [Arcobacteraceae bacterium]|jgi:hypothetical protein|nr:hypothetical protein [Arcobacteraceae bacterium]